MTTLNDGVKKAGPKWTRQFIQKGERSVLDFIVIGNGNSTETEIHVCAADVGSTEQCLKKNKNGAEMLKFVESNEMKTLNYGVKKAGPE